MTTTVVAGIDVSKDRLDVHVGGEVRSFDNSRGGFKPLRGWLRRHGVGRVVMEATGRYHRGVHQSLWADGVETVVVNPRNARRFAECLGHLGKTDRLDARALAEYGRVVSDLPPTTPRKESLNRLEDLMVMRNAFVDRRAELRQTRSEMADPAAKTVAKRGLAVDGRAIAALDAKIEALVKADPELRQRYEVFLSVCGIGPVAAAALCCWMPELGTVSDREAAALLGVAPHPRDSGTLNGARHIRGGRRRPRDVMYMAALSASRHNPRMKEMYERLRARGKHHKVAVVAVMRKLVALVNALLRKRRLWSAEIAAAGCTALPPGARPVQRVRQDGFVRLGDVLGRTMGRA